MLNRIALTGIIAFVFSHCCAQVQSLPKLSPRTQQYLLDSKNAKNQAVIDKGYVYKQTVNGLYMSGMIKVNSNLNESDFDALQIHVGTKAGKIWTILVPINNIQAFTRLQGIDYIELDEPVTMKLDSVRKATHVDSVHQGIELPMPYTGKDVIVGVVDVGFDFTHPTLYDTTGHQYRVKRVWEEKINGTPPAGFLYGNEITDTNAIKAAHTENSINSHGMHVTGIAAGSGFGSTNKKFQGMAYESDIVFVGIMPDSLQWQNTGISDIIDGINYVFSYANLVQKPCVVNLSWGSPVGPHDGTSLFSQAIDAMSGAGRIFVCAAGNEGDTRIHLQKTFSSVDTTVSTFVGFDSYLSTKNTWLDIWGEENQQFCAKVALYHGSEISNTGFICLDNTTHRVYLTGLAGDTCIVTLTTSSAEFNNKPRMYLSLESHTADSVCLTLQSTGGTINAWNGYVRDGGGYFGELTTGGRSWAVNGDVAYSITDFVSTHSAITVGAYAAKTRYRGLDGSTYTFTNYVGQGQLVPFSSRGPTVTGTIKPDVTAPGLCVVSSLNSFDSAFVHGGAEYSADVSSYLDSSSGRTYYYGQFSGTSMATPATSGIIALMLQANPVLNSDHIRTILSETAIQDTFTHALPVDGTNSWGHGKINAYRAVLTAITYPSSVKNIGADQNIALNIYPNPAHKAVALSLNSPVESNAFITVYNTIGEPVLAETWKLIPGNNEKQINISHLSAGNYFAEIISEGLGKATRNLIVR